MKKLLLALFFLPTLAFADRLGGLNPNSQVLLSTQAASGGASTLEVFNNFNGTRSSPTASIGMSNAFLGGVSGSTYTFAINFSSVASVSSVALSTTNAASGSNTNIQSKQNGTFYGDGGFQYDSSVSSVSITGALKTGENATIGSAGTNPLKLASQTSGAGSGATIGFYTNVTSLLGTFGFDSTNNFYGWKDSSGIRMSGARRALFPDRSTFQVYNVTGTNYFSFRSSDTLTTQDIVLPAAEGTAGQALVIDNIQAAGGGNDRLTNTKWGTVSGGSGGYALEPATAPAIGFNYGFYTSTLVVNGANAMGILSGANRARIREAGILSLQNVNTDSADSTGVFMAAASTGTTPAFVTARRSSGTTTSPVATGAGMTLLQISAGGYGTTNWSNGSTGRMDFIAEEAFTDTSQATAWKLSTTSSTVIAPVQRLYIAGNGAATASSSWTYNQPIQVTSIRFADGTVQTSSPAVSGSAAVSISTLTAGATNFIFNQIQVLQVGASFYIAVGQIDEYLRILGNNGASGMSVIDRGLTVNFGTYTVAGASASFIVQGIINGSTTTIFQVDPSLNLVTSSVPFVARTTATFSGPMIGANGAGATDQVWSSSGSTLPPYWKTVSTSAGSTSGGYFLQPATITPNFALGVLASTGVVTSTLTVNFGSFATLLATGTVTLGTTTINGTANINGYANINSTVTTPNTLNYGLIVGGHIEVSSSTPVISACGATPNGSVVGNDQYGKITIGGGVVTSCTMTFAVAWPNAPACTILSNTAITAPTGSTSTTVFTLGAGATFAGDVIMYTCGGYR